MTSLIKYLLAVALFFNAFTLFSQSKEDFPDDINGLILSGKKYITQDIINKFGTPLAYDPLSPDTGEEEEFREEFFGYGEAFNISLDGFGEVSGAYITSPGYALFNGHLKVGDNSLIFHTENHIIKIIHYYVPD